MITADDLGPWIIVSLNTAAIIAERFDNEAAAYHRCAQLNSTFGGQRVDIGGYVVLREVDEK